MGHLLPVTYVVALSIAVQSAAAVMAFRLIAVTGRKTAWVLISLALTLMAVRRIIPLYYLVCGKVSAPPDLMFESIGLALSMAMALGIAMIGPLFRERVLTEKALRESEERLAGLNEELERRVDERTALLQRRSKELELANERLKEVDLAKSAFLAAMSHELRTPLNSIIGFSSILHDEWLGPVNKEQKENLAAVLTAGRHLLDMISDVLDVAQIEAGAVTPVVEEFDLHDLLAEAENEAAAAIRERGLDLRSELLRQQMATDRGRLLQCVRNILSNAVKFTDRGSVTVAARIVSSPGGTPEAEMVEIAVTDTGIGIGAEELERIFQPFRRIVTPQREIVPGIGLGLFLTRKIVTEILKGEIGVSSEYGKGSRFSLRIPVRLP